MVDTGYRSNQIMETLGMRGLQFHEHMIENQLARHGVRMGDVRFVCHTHLHIDHAGKDDLFPMNTTVVLNRKELEYSVSGLMHPQYPAPDIKHLIDRLHTKSALRFLDLEITGPIELMPGVYCDAANAHTEGSMNIIVQTADGIATICGDVIYDFNDQIVTPFHEIHDCGAAHHRQPRHHASARRRPRSRSCLSSSRYLLPVHDRPAKIEGGNVVGRLHDQVPGPIVQSPARSATGSRPDAIRGSTDDACHLAQRIRDPDRPLRAGRARSAPASTSRRDRSGIRSITICCSRTCPATCAGAGMRGAAWPRSSARRTNATA